VLGNIYSNQQKRIEEVRSANENTANRLTNLLKNFSSDNPRERKMAVVISTYLAERNQLPGELVSVLKDIAESDSNKDVSNAAIQSLDAVANAGSPQATEARTILKGLPGRVYIQVPGRDRMQAARQISALLTAQGYLVPGIETRPEMPARSQVRYFHREDSGEAATMQSLLAEHGTVTTILFVPGFEQKVRSRQFEIWLAK
jgi:hypothetical protein